MNPSENNNVYGWEFFDDQADATLDPSFEVCLLNTYPGSLIESLSVNAPDQITKLSLCNLQEKAKITSFNKEPNPFVPPGSYSLFEV